MDDVERTGNLIEAGFWMVFGIVVAAYLWGKAGRFTALGAIAAAIAVLFGVSDLAEARTGAWWRPWWLFVWKAACLTGLAVCFLRYRTPASASAPVATGVPGPGSSAPLTPG